MLLDVYGSLDFVMLCVCSVVVVEVLLVVGVWFG